MLTPQEIQQKKFEKAVFGGYDMTSVDDFLDIMTEDYVSLYKENVALKAKMKVLVEKIEEYRSVDDAMRKALLTAQNTAKELVDNAKREADALTSHAREDADSKISAMQEEIRLEEGRLKDARKKVDRYVASIVELHKKSLSELEGMFRNVSAPPEEAGEEDTRDTLEFCAEGPGKQEPDESEPPPQKAQHVTIGEIDKAVLFASEKAVITKKNTSDEQAHPTDGMEVRVFEVQLPEKGPVYPDDTGEIVAYTPKPKFNFENLKFGKDYREKDE